MVLGYDIGAGGGTNAKPLPMDAPTETLLVKSPANFVSGESAVSAALEIWGLDPRATVVVEFVRRRKPDTEWADPEAGPAPAANLTATIVARTLARTSDGVRKGPVLPAADLFVNGGALDASDHDDGCELESAAQGVRFELSAARSADCNYDVVAFLRVIPTRVVCKDLLDAIVGAMTIVVEPGSF